MIDSYLYDISSQVGDRLLQPRHRSKKESRVEIQRKIDGFNKAMTDADTNAGGGGTADERAGRA